MASGIGGLVGSIMGNDAGKEDMAKALGLSNDALQQLKNLYVPTTSEQEVTLDNPELAGTLTAEQLGDSALAGVSTDPRLKNAQMKALEELSGLSQTGLGVEDQAAFNNLRRQAGSEAQAANQATLQNAAASGNLDSGNTLLAQLNAGQQQSNRLQQAGEAQAAQAAAARREALSQYANMSSSMANTDFSQKASQATAKDAINKFNAQNRQDVAGTNLTNKQAIANQTAANANQAKLYNSGLVQQQFQNNLSKATGVSGQTNKVADQYATQGTNAANGQAAMNGAILGIAGNIATGGLSGAASAASGAATDAAGGTTDYSKDYLKQK